MTSACIRLDKMDALFYAVVSYADGNQWNIFLNNKNVVFLLISVEEYKLESAFYTGVLKALGSVGRGVPGGES